MTLQAIMSYLFDFSNGDKVSLSRVGWVEGAGCHQHSLVDPLPGIHRLTSHSAPGGPIST